MFSPPPIEAAAAQTPPAEVRQVAAAVPKITFRPPGLADKTVVAEPFTRVGPRLRTREFFDGEPVW